MAFYELKIKQRTLIFFRAFLHFFITISGLHNFFLIHIAACNVIVASATI